MWRVNEIVNVYCDFKRGGWGITENHSWQVETVTENWNAKTQKKTIALLNSNIISFTTVIK